MSETGPNVLRVGLLSTIERVDPLTAQDGESLFVGKQIFESPFGTPDSVTEAVPRLFKGPLRADSPRRLRATVKREVKFSDGSPMTARDLVASLRRSAVVADHTDLELDGDDVIFRLRRENARFALLLTHGQCGVMKRRGSEILGTGPFKLHPSSHAGHIRLVRNPYHPVPAKVDEIHFVTYPVDAYGRPTALIEAIQAGEVDLTNCLGRDAIHQVSGVRKSILPGVSTCFLHINTQSAALVDPRARQAIAHSLDRLKLSSLCYSNALAFAAGSVLPRSFGNEEDRLGHDPERAAKLMAQVDRPPRQLKMLTIWGPRPYLPNPDAVTDEIISQLRPLGIEVEKIHARNSSEYFQHTVAGTADLTLTGWMADTMDPADFLESNLASYRVPNRENLAVCANEGRLQNPRVDELLQLWRAERKDRHLEELFALTSEEASLVPLFYGASVTVYGFAVQNFQPSPLATSSLREIDLWRDAG